MYSKQFSVLPVASQFKLNGNDYVKQTSRTALMLTNGRVFYVGQMEKVYAA